MFVIILMIMGRIHKWYWSMGVYFPRKSTCDPLVQIIEWHCMLEYRWNVMAHGDVREGKWREHWRMEWIASALYTNSEHDVSSITTADAHTSVASSPLNWRVHRFKWTRTFRRKTKSGFCACAFTFQTQSTIPWATVGWSKQNTDLSLCF